jgi:hypothetical protein
MFLDHTKLEFFFSRKQIVKLNTPNGQEAGVGDKQSKKPSNGRKRVVKATGSSEALESAEEQSGETRQIHQLNQSSL